MQDNPSSDSASPIRRFVGSTFESEHAPPTNALIASRRTVLIPGQFESRLLQTPCEAAAIASIRIDDQHVGMGGSVAADELCQLMCMIAFVQDVAADDQVELTQSRACSSKCGNCSAHHWV